MDEELKRVNVGCGQTPTPGWRNYDNSISVRLANWPSLITLLLEKVGLLTEASGRFLAFVRRSDIHIRWADATRRIPLPADSVAALYASHVLEHLTPQEGRAFLTEARRVLAPGGVVRISVPDLAKLINRYLDDGDADAFMERSYLGRSDRRGFVGVLQYLFVGDRRHLWMYDGQSLIRLLSLVGFENVGPVDAGETSIPNPGKLDLYERGDESVFVEAWNPYEEKGYDRQGPPARHMP